MATKQRLSFVEALDDASTPATVSESVWLDGGAYAESHRLRKELIAAQAKADGLKSDVPRLQAELDQVQARLRASELKLTFQWLGADGFDELVSKNPSTDPRLAWDEQTLAIDLIAGATVKVEGVWESDHLSVDDVKALFGRLNDGQQKTLFQAALQLQLEAPKPFTVPATGGTLLGGQSSTTALSGESPTPDS